jgi:hypothetical protein
MVLTSHPNTTSKEISFIEGVVLKQLSSSEEPILISSDLTVVGGLAVSGLLQMGGGCDADTDGIAESLTRKYLTTTDQTILGVKTFTSQPVLSGVGLAFNNLTIASNGNHTWSNNGLDKVLTATNSSGSTSNITFLNGGNVEITCESSKITSLKNGGATKVQCTSQTFKLFTCNLDIPLGNGVGVGGIRINGSVSTPTFLHTISGTDTFNINAPMTSITGALNFTGFVTVTGTTNLTNTSMVYLCNTSAGACTLRLTDATLQAGRFFKVIRKDTGTTNALTINVTTNTQTINGAQVNLSTTLAYFCYTIFCDGAGYYTV